jgi:hypothetical protein
MIVRRLLSGVLVVGLAAPLLAAAPHAHPPRSAVETIPAPPPGVTARVFARAEAAQAAPAAQPSSAPASPPASGASSAAPSPDASPGTPASVVSPEIAARARAEFEANRSGKIERSRYTAEMNGRLTDAVLAGTAASLQALGPVKSFTQVRKVTQGPLALYVFRIEFEKPPVIEQAIAWNASGKVDFLQYGPAR